MEGGHGIPFRTWNPVEREWILTVPSRAPLAAHTDLRAGKNSECPFCDVFAPDDADQIRVVRSKHPMVPTITGPEHPRVNQHSVLIYAKDHDQRLGTMSVGRCRDLLVQIALLSDQLMTNSNIEAVCATEAVGGHFGVTVGHPHAQVIGLEFEPRNISMDDADGCRLCAGRSGRHTVRELPSAVAEVPPWARLPFETVIYTRRHAPSLGATNSDELADIAQLIWEILGAYRSQTQGEVQYLLAVMQAPRSRLSTHHLRVELLPLHKPDGSLKRPGVLETMFGVYINPTRASESAAHLRLLLNEGADR
ncbi:hypothetical protein [Micromonospora humida]|uniref:Galactose-1-phosphate uridylyltransferase n=1 Tax=Micromonospora humida TaxID=2809018 RepID=A0ABS2IPT6_9ACTN|nr:hypothetical protein [Micromonospora humida]MBM7075544.1 hypothetical protein [Micromonospora humida]